MERDQLHSMPIGQMGNPSSGRGLTDRRQRAGRLVLWIAPAFGTGIALYINAGQEPGGFYWGIAALTVAIGGIIARRLPVIVLAIMVSLGFMWGGGRALLIDTSAIVSETPPLTITANVDDVEIRGGSKARLILSNLSVEGGLWGRAARAMPDGVPDKVRVTVRNRHTGDLLPGSVIRAKMILRPAPGPVVPGGYDFARDAYFKGLGGVGFILGHPETIGHGPATIKGFLTHIRLRIVGLIDDSLTGDTAALASALLTGFRGPVDEAVLDDYRNAGLAHLLAISGLHIGLVAGGMFIIVRLFLVCLMLGARRLLPDKPAGHHIWPIKQIAAATALLIGAVYLGLSGMNVPAERAFIMTAFALLAVMLNRTAISLRLVAWAALIVLIIHPHSVLSAGFQMSFAAVTALVAGYDFLRPYAATLFGDVGIRKLRGYVLGLAITSLVAGLATGPIAAFHFGRIAVFGLLGNLAAMPVMGFIIMPAGIIALCLMPFGLHDWPLMVMGWGIEWVSGAATYVSDIPFAERFIGTGPDSALVLLMGGGLFLCLWVGKHRLWGLAPIVIGVAIWAGAHPPHLLIAEQGALVQVGQQITPTRRHSYTKQHWQQILGNHPNDITKAHCDTIGCAFILPDDRGSLTQLFNRDGISDACGRATIIIAPFRINPRKCTGSLVIDTGILASSDAVSVSMGRTGAFKLHHTAQTRASRPWATTSNADYLADRLRNVEKWNAAARLRAQQRD